MAKMASLDAMAREIPTHYEMFEMLENSVKAEHPEDSLAMIYTRVYGILRAHITEEQLIHILKLRNAI